MEKGPIISKRLKGAFQGARGREVGLVLGPVAGADRSTFTFGTGLRCVDFGWITCCRCQRAAMDVQLSTT